MAKRDDDCFIRKDADGFITASITFTDDEKQFVTICDPRYPTIITMSIDCFRALNAAVEGQF